MAIELDGIVGNTPRHIALGLIEVWLKILGHQEIEACFDYEAI